MSKDKTKRIGKRELQTRLERLTERDKVIIQALHDYKYLMTGQVQRLYFRQAISKLAALRATSRCLLKLRDWGLLTTLKRRIGGARAGSGSYVWTLTPVGYRLLDLLNRINPDSGPNNKAKPVRKRPYEPAPAFLRHTLAVAELAIRLTELAASRKIGITARQLEPECWRSFTNAGGTLSTLRPDLYVVTIADGGKADYEDSWFIEVDLATESPAVVVCKCQQYLAYLRSGEEQAQNDVFPLVAWVVPDEKRKGSLTSHIAEKLSDAAGLFIVITMGELEALVLTGAENEQTHLLKIP